MRGDSKASIETRAVHAGESRARIGGAVTPPVFQTSTYISADERDYHDIRYLRLSNSPNHLALHAKLASLESCESALVTASGMAAISTALLCVLKSGDHLLAQLGIYGGTHTFLTQELPALGIEVSFVDASDPAQWARACKPNTRAFYAESMTNPLLEVGDLPGVVSFAREKKLVTLIDNTLATPVNFLPAEIGFDFVLHSATKYLNGHSDIVAGVIAASHAHIQNAKRKLDHLGGSLDPHSCFLLNRGLKTLPLRVRKQNENAQALAEFLAAHARVRKVHYAGLRSHPTAARARELFGGCGGLLSFEHAGGADGARNMLRKLELALPAVSLGGAETLVTLPARTSHAGLQKHERESAGIGGALVRVAAGIENIEDVIADFRRALD